MWRPTDSGYSTLFWPATKPAHAGFGLPAPRNGRFWIVSPFDVTTVYFVGPEGVLIQLIEKNQA